MTGRCAVGAVQRLIRQLISLALVRCRPIVCHMLNAIAFPPIVFTLAVRKPATYFSQLSRDYRHNTTTTRTRRLLMCQKFSTKTSLHDKELARKSQEKNQAQHTSPTRRRDATVELSGVGVGGVYWATINAQRSAAVTSTHFNVFIFFLPRACVFLCLYVYVCFCMRFGVINA